MQIETNLEPVLPNEGLHVAHLFFRLDYSQWDLLDQRARLEAKTSLAQLLQDVRSDKDTQLLTFSVVTPKADLGFMLLTPDLQRLDLYCKRLAVALGPEVLSPEFSYLSMTERSEYTTTEDEYAHTLTSQGISKNSPEFSQKMEAFRQRMAKYLSDRLHPNLPDWPVVCFYPMSKRRAGADNWFSLDFATRKSLMAGHAHVGRSYQGRILQLITGSTGLDDMEWGVTLFARTASDIKAIVYEMRFDEVSARYAEFGSFFIGLQMPLQQLFERLAI